MPLCLVDVIAWISTDAANDYVFLSTLLPMSVLTFGLISTGYCVYM